MKQCVTFFSSIFIISSIQCGQIRSRFIRLDLLFLHSAQVLNKFRDFDCGIYLRMLGWVVIYKFFVSCPRCLFGSDSGLIIRFHQRCFLLLSFRFHAFSHIIRQILLLLLFKGPFFILLGNLGNIRKTQNALFIFMTC